METDYSNFFQTKSQANDFAERLATISEKIYQTNFDLEKLLLDQFGIKKKDAFLKLLRTNAVDLKSHTALKQFITSMREKIATLPVLSLTLSFEPKEKTLKALAEWFPLNIKKQVLFDITVDPLILGGAIIDYKGKHLDFSIRPTFEEALNTILTLKKEEARKEQPAHINIDAVSLGR